MLQDKIPDMLKDSTRVHLSWVEEIPIGRQNGQDVFIRIHHSACLKDCLRLQAFLTPDVEGEDELARLFIGRHNAGVLG